MKRPRKLGAMLLACLALGGMSMTGCGSTESGESRDQVVVNESADLRRSELHYLNKTDRFATGEGEVVAHRPFRAVTFQVTAPESSRFEYQLREPGGKWGSWQPVPFEWRQGEMGSGQVVLDTEADAVRVRASEGAEFVRLELFAKAQVIHDDDEGLGIYASPGSIRQSVAIAGRWAPPSDVLNAGASQYMPYEGPPAVCAGGLLPGTREIGDWIRQHFPQATSYGGYACRGNTADPSVLSIHAAGRALDVFVPLSGGAADNTKGDAIGNHLIKNARYMGVLYIIWDQAQWSGSASGTKMSAYTGPNPHTDHLHVEFSTAAARDRATQFFKDGKPPPGGVAGLNPAHNHPSAVSMAAGTQQVYIRGPGNSLWVKGWNGSVWGSWLDLGGQLTSAPSATSPAPNVTHVYVRGTDNQLHVKGFANNTWGDWLPLGGILTSGPSAVSPNPNVTWVFIRAQDNRLWVKGWANNTWGDWVQIGGDFTFASDPSAVSMSPGTTQVYVRGHDNALWVIGFDGTQWGTWVNLGGALSSAPAAVSASPNTTYVYVRGSDNAIHVKGFSNNTWGSWLSLGGTMTSSPTAVSDTLNTNHIYARGSDNAVWVKGFANNTWGDWVSIGGTMPD
ncbi:hypothetical protein F0U62_27250 [Cystobacter fuscus]|uniref:hypothetical protein n=1 Tax=Cystobacter fuscus TaxID=43 RepID=UPI002B27F088|nr:hypothetical protein F0U62_27250 [Cystobacter fuscus]